MLKYTLYCKYNQGNVPKILKLNVLSAEKCLLLHYYTVYLIILLSLVEVELIFTYVWTETNDFFSMDSSAAHFLHWLFAL